MVVGRVERCWRTSSCASHATAAAVRRDPSRCAGKYQERAFLGKVTNSLGFTRSRKWLESDPSP
jgi:hypothetical protein